MLAREVDFFSVGTNDLTSYTLAMDRGHPKLAAQVDPCNPAILALIGNACDALHEHGKWLGICGGVASDPQAVPILVGLGVILGLFALAVGLIVIAVLAVVIAFILTWQRWVTGPARRGPLEWLSHAALERLR